MRKYRVEGSGVLAFGFMVFFDAIVGVFWHQETCVTQGM